MPEPEEAKHGFRGTGAADPVGGVFVGLACVYAAKFFQTLGPDAPRLSKPAGLATGFFRLGTGLWLMYLVFAVALNFTMAYTLPV